MVALASVYTLILYSFCVWVLESFWWYLACDSLRVCVLSLLKEQQRLRCFSLVHFGCQPVLIFCWAYEFMYSCSAGFVFIQTCSCTDEKYNYLDLLFYVYILVDLHTLNNPWRKFYLWPEHDPSWYLGHWVKGQVCQGHEDNEL